MAKVSVIVSELAVTVVTEGSMSSTVAVVSAGSLRGGQEVEEIDDEAETDREAETGRRPRRGPRAGMRGRTGRTQAHRERRAREAAQARAGRRGHRRRQRTWQLAGASRLPPCRLPAACLGLPVPTSAAGLAEPRSRPGPGRGQLSSASTTAGIRGRWGIGPSCLTERGSAWPLRAGALSSQRLCASIKLHSLQTHGSQDSLAFMTAKAGCAF